MAARSKVRTVFDRSNTVIVGSNTARGMDVSAFCVVLSCVGSGFANGLIPRPRSPTKCPKLIHKFQKSTSESEQAGEPNPN
jgi:hypothetical protein